MSSDSIHLVDRSEEPSLNRSNGGRPMETSIHLFHAAPANRRILNSWKEIASYMGRGVRTLQRYEQLHRLPVRRPAGKNHSAVLALSDELDAWLNKTPVRRLGYVRPVLVLLDHQVAGAISDRRVALESAHFNVLAALNIDEALATADKFDVDGFIFDYQDKSAESENTSAEMCESLKAHFPNKPLFVLVSASHMNGNSPKSDYVIPAGNLVALVNTVTAVLGVPKVA